MPTRKRAVDFLLSAAALPVVLPIIAILGCWIKLDSRGPVFFRQARVGLNQRHFDIYKLRTMTDRQAAQIDQHKEAVVAKGSDHRITRAGRLLRALSLDELPQIFNILAGDMSFVGPRPVLPEQLAAIPADKFGRFSVRPGITGLAQVTGRRSLSWPDQLAADDLYARTATAWLDIKILARTAVVVLAREGVYGDAALNWRAYLKTNASPPDGPAGAAADQPDRGSHARPQPPNPD
jgi:lipopolysaccharide/colanic/teichoic acid biosynthesis glycosyltransferase